MKLAQMLRVFGLCGFFVLVALGTYYQALSVYFLSDDFIWLLEASRSTFASLPAHFISADGFFYRPTTKIYFFLMYQVFGLDAWWYHLLNILIHGVSGLLVFSFLRRLLERSELQARVRVYLALFSAIYFVVHPIHLEGVVWVSAVTELIPSLLMLVALNIYLMPFKRQYLVVFPALYFLAMGGHEFAIVLPAMFFVIDLYLVRGGVILRIKEVVQSRRLLYGVMLVTALLYLFLRYISQSHWQGGDYSYDLVKLPFNFAGNLLGYVFFALGGPWFYPVYEMIRVSLRSQVMVLGMFGLLLIASVILLRKYVLGVVRKIPEVVYLCCALFVISLLPFLGLGTIAERYVYFASLFLYVIFLYVIYLLCRKLFREQKVMKEYIGVLIFFSFLFSALSFWAMRDWHSASAKVTALVFGSCESVAQGDTVAFDGMKNREGRAWVFQVGYEQAIQLVCGKEVKSLSR